MLTQQLWLLSEMHQEIEATLTEMESCMRLLFPDYGLKDTETVGSSPSTSHSANRCPSDDEQPCCSKDVKDDGKEGKKQLRSSKEASNGKGKNPEKDRGKMEQKGNNEEEGNEEKKSEDKEMEGEKKRDGIEQEEKKEWKVKDGEDAEKSNSEGEEEQEEDKEEEEEEHFGDMFIRNSGLISHSYSLDLNLSSGGYSASAQNNATNIIQCLCEAEALCGSVIGFHYIQLGVPNTLPLMVHVNNMF